MTSCQKEYDVKLLSRNVLGDYQGSVYSYWHGTDFSGNYYQGDTTYFTKFNVQSKVNDSIQFSYLGTSNTFSQNDSNYYHEYISTWTWKNFDLTKKDSLTYSFRESITSPNGPYSYYETVVFKGKK